jgi:hypothetical protein
MIEESNVLVLLYRFKINLQSKQTFYFFYLYLFSYNVVQHDSHIRLCLYRLKVTRRCH